MIMLFSDGAFLGYFVVTVLCAYGFGLFVWGVCVAKHKHWHVSLVYLYMTGMFGSLGYSYLFAVFSRYYTLTDQNLSLLFRMSIGWETRTIPLILVLLGVVSHMTYRAFWLKFESKEEG